MGPFQPHLPQYPLSNSGRQNRRFQYNWFKKFPWLEYSPSKNAAFCFPSFIFYVNPTQHRTFIVDGFTNYRKVNDCDNCSFLKYVGDPNSPHNISVNSVLALQNVPRRIDKVLNAQTKEEIQKNRLWLQTTIEGIKWLTLQGCALRDNDESMHSINQGNFLEMIKFMERLRLDIGVVVLENVLGNDKFTSHMIQKEVLHIIANKVRNMIRQEIGAAKFCCLVDESKDSSNKEQMAIVLRFVDAYDVVHERFFDIIHVTNTMVLNLKKEICGALIHAKLDANDLRGQGYDGASKILCTMAKKFYPNDFTSQDMYLLKFQLAHYGYGVIQDPRFERLPALSDLCQKLVETNKSHIYFLIERLIHLILTLPVSSATTERAFSTMKYVTYVLHNKMDEDFLADSMTVYIEREFSQNVDADSVIDEFYFQKPRRVQLK